MMLSSFREVSHCEQKYGSNGQGVVKFLRVDFK